MDSLITRRDAQIDTFTGALDETPDLWRSLDIRVIAVRVDDVWHNLVTRCCLDDRAPTDVPRISDLPATERLWCWQEVRPIGDLHTFLNVLRAGEIRVGDVVVRAWESRGFAGQVGTGDGPYTDAYTALSSPQQATSTVVQPREHLAHHLFIKPSASMPALTSIGTGSDRSLDRSLRALERPFDGLAGLIRVAVRTSGDPTRWDRPQIEVVAPLGASFDVPHLVLQRGELRGGVWVASAEGAARCTVGYIAEMEDGGFENGTVHLNAQRDPARPQHATFSLQVSSLARQVTLLLRLGPHLVARETVQDTAPTLENPHLAAYEVVDPGLGCLRDALRLTEANARKQKDAARQFERAVAQLLSLAGFHVDALGGFGGTQEAVDVLARTPDGTHMLAVECTLGALASRDGKPGRLMQRANALRKALERHGTEVIPVMVTSSLRHDIPKGDMEFVAHDGLVVLCREELDELMTCIEQGGTASDVIAFCRQHVPKPRSRSQQVMGLLRSKA